MSRPGHDLAPNHSVTVVLVTVKTRDGPRREAFYFVLKITSFTLFKGLTLLLRPSNSIQLDNLPTFVSAHTFCASRKAWFKRHARAGVDIDAINHAINYMTKMKAKFSYCAQIKFNEPVLKPGTPE